MLEYNCRFGDPEAQPVMMRLKSDLVSLCHKAVTGELAGVQLEWDPRVALGVVLACGGYPGDYEMGDSISGLDRISGSRLKVFHAGTRVDGADIITSGGRVLCVVGLGDTVAEAQQIAYEGVAKVSWQNAYFRRDIGHRAIDRS